MFNSTAELLSDDQCQNGTGVSGVAIENAATETTNGSSEASATPTGAASRLSPGLGVVVKSRTSLPSCGVVAKEERLH
jgi:hypothetical protein